jgi:hypothetical protein
VNFRVGLGCDLHSPLVRVYEHVNGTHGNLTLGCNAHVGRGCSWYPGGVFLSSDSVKTGILISGPVFCFLLNAFFQFSPRSPSIRPQKASGYGLLQLPRLLL